MRKNVIRFVAGLLAAVSATAAGCDDEGRNETGRQLIGAECTIAGGCDDGDEETPGSFASLL
jgi:hypothetical protein